MPPIASREQVSLPESRDEEMMIAPEQKSPYFFEERTEPSSDASYHSTSLKKDNKIANEQSSEHSTITKGMNEAWDPMSQKTNKIFRFPPLSPENKNFDHKMGMQRSKTSSSPQHSNRSASTGRAYDSLPLRSTVSDAGSFHGGGHSLAPSGHRLLTKPILIERKSSSSAPMDDVLVDIRDDASQVNSHIDTDSGFLTFPSSPAYFQAVDKAGDQAMDEIIIQKYIAEKNKARTAEKNNSMLHSHINQMKRLFDMQRIETENERSNASLKAEQQQNAIESLEETVKQLQNQIKAKDRVIEKKLVDSRENAESKVQIARDEAEVKLISIRKELMTLQSKHGGMETKLRQENEKHIEFTKKFKDMEHSLELKNIELENKQKMTRELEEKISLLEIKRAEADKSSESDAEALSLKLENVSERYESEKQRAEEFANELKDISYQYVENLEKLDVEQKKTFKLAKALDESDAKLKEVTTKAAKANKELEDIARGFVHTDELLEKESKITSKLSLAVTALNEQLKKEVERNEKLTSQFTETQKCHSESSDEAAKLKSFSKALSDELSEVKKNLNSVVSHGNELARGLKKSKKAYEGSQAQLKEIKDTNATMSSELANWKDKHFALSSELGTTAEQLKEYQEMHLELSNLLNEKNEAYVQLEARTDQERSINEEIINDDKEAINNLTTSLQDMTSKSDKQQESISSYHAELKEYQVELTEITGKLKASEVEKSKMEVEFRNEMEDLSEKLADEQERVQSMTEEINNLESKYSGIFNSLVETEEILQATKEELTLVKMQLETKDDEFEPVEKMLREEIASRETSLKKEQEKNISLTSQSVQMSKKCNEMYTHLVEAEERILAMEDMTNSLKNEITAKDQASKQLQLALEKEKNGPHQRKLKVAKKMIQGEKNRHRALQKEIIAKDLIIERLEAQSAGYLNDLQNTRECFEVEKEKKATHSGRALQEMHKQLEDERRRMKQDKENLRSQIKSEKAQIKSLTIRLKALEESTGGEDISNTLKEQHDIEERVRILTEENIKLERLLHEKTESQIRIQKRLTDVDTKLNDLTIHLDTMTRYCHSLEQEKKLLLKDIDTLRKPGASSSSNRSLFNLLERDDSGDDDNDDDDTVSGMSLSDFSVARVPSTRQLQSNSPRHRGDMTSRTFISPKSESSHDHTLTDDEIELSFDSRINF
mmetsp:Transcript_15759/g.18296  ORF Transcript_15759/g.18296 Transcript_15759/m.18296 type:complete len:1183 (+) Transcript_15759:97-3645(+)